MRLNLGQTTLRRRRRPVDPMAAFDSLPPPLRHWLHDAALPWSTRSVQRIWSKSMARGLSQDEALALLSQSEARTIARDRHSTLSKSRPQT